MKGISVVSLILLFALCMPTAWADISWRNHADITLGRDDNISRAERSRDQVDDLFAAASISRSLFYQTHPRRLYSVRGFAELERFDEISGLDRNTLGLQGLFRWQPSSGFSAPMVELNLMVRNDDFQVEQRDSTVIRSQLFVTRRLTDRVMFSVGGEYQWVDSEGTVFDTRQRRFFINADYQLTQPTAIYGTYSHINGDTISTAQRRFCNGVLADDILGLINAADAIEPDQAFNDALCGDWIAYRLKAQTHALTLGINRALGNRMSIDFSAMGVRVDARGDNEYQRLILQLSLLRRF